MHSHTILRFLVASLTIALIAGAMIRTASAAERITWTDTSSPEAQVVQGCSGFDVTTSYTVNRVHNLVEEYTHEAVFERQQVDFSGAMGNSETGLSYAYDGHYTTVADYDKGSFAISNLQLRFEVGTPGQFAVELKKVDFKLIDSPPAIVQAIVPNVLQRDLCGLFAARAAGYAPNDISTNEPLQDFGPGQSIAEDAINSALPQAVNVHTENSAIPQRVDVITENSALPKVAAPDDHMTPWTELDPCDTSLPGKPC